MGVRFGFICFSCFVVVLDYVNFVLCLAFGGWWVGLFVCVLQVVFVGFGFVLF